MGPIVFLELQPTCGSNRLSALACCSRSMDVWPVTTPGLVEVGSGVIGTSLLSILAIGSSQSADAACRSLLSQVPLNGSCGWLAVVPGRMTGRPRCTKWLGCMAECAGRLLQPEPWKTLCQLEVAGSYVPASWLTYYVNNASKYLDSATTPRGRASSIRTSAGREVSHWATVTALDGVASTSRGLLTAEAVFRSLVRKSQSLVADGSNAELCDEILLLSLRAARIFVKGFRLPFPGCEKALSFTLRQLADLTILNFFSFIHASILEIVSIRTPMYFISILVIMLSYSLSWP